MEMYFIIVGITAYIVGIFITINSDTTENVEFHKGGFLGAGYTTCSHRRTTTSDAWMAIIWPIRCVWGFIKLIIALLLDVCIFLNLLLGIKLDEMKLIKKLQDWAA